MLTSRSPHAHRRTQDDLSPIQPRSAHTPQCSQNARPGGLDGAGGSCRLSCSDGRQVETQGCTREVSERAREVVEALGLGDDGGDRDGGSGL